LTVYIDDCRQFDGTVFVLILRDISTPADSVVTDSGAALYATNVLVHSAANLCVSPDLRSCSCNRNVFRKLLSRIEHHSRRVFCWWSIGAGVELSKAR